MTGLCRVSHSQTFILSKKSDFRLLEGDSPDCKMFRIVIYSNSPVGIPPGPGVGVAIGVKVGPVPGTRVVCPVGTSLGKGVGVPLGKGVGLTKSQ